MSSQIIDCHFEPYQLLNEHQQTLQAGSFGACACFVGSMRDFNDNASVSGMQLEHYPQMTAHYLDKLEQQARQQWPLLDCLIVHRVGAIAPNDPIVLIGCWSAHRRAALEACAWLIEELKQRAPFWKKETRPDGERWVESNTDGH
ncbi:molybdenum cofactor biosynthesis protein MoaE [Methylophaga lonarensis MPL]|uniref:Molybdopterin synthase catalytic subunit n=1 Tax=Methylophaga lonarensis MPL TaxID=1286106 RepID=M7P2L3_9GAMM|nr:molybdenum cofactor biosynthesis protein MoaE [Methylophaga lonarensis]EMR13727.1 molybdenum cofactor biosynthesis protein MoaE [Methylophaga lonarensis MPL]